MRSVLAWLGTIFGAISFLVLLQHGFQFGFADALRILVEYWRDVTRSLLFFAQPLVLVGEPILGEFPTWWPEGLLMLAMMVSTWVRAVLTRQANAEEFAEFLAVSLLSGFGSYFIDVAQTASQVVFFGIYGSFVQLLAKGLVTLPKNNTDGEGWVGRYMLQSTASAAVFILANAGLRLAGF